VIAANESILDEGQAFVDNPKITLIDVEVQHPTGKGEFSFQSGTLGAAIIIQPSGQPKVVLRIGHPDNSSLAAFLRSEDLLEFIDILLEAADQANEISDIADKAQRQ
jgi:hypothetical protein